MRTNSTTTKAGSKQIPTATEMDAIALLTEDHAKVKAMFEQYEGLGDRAHATKQKLAMQICTELTKHATAEEEIFYPAVREASKENEDLVDEATVNDLASLADKGRDGPAQTRVLVRRVVALCRLVGDRSYPRLRQPAARILAE